MDKLFEPVPAIVPFFGGWPIWLAVIVALVGVPTLFALNNAVETWFRRRRPGWFTRRAMLIQLGISAAFCVAVLVVVLANHPKFEWRKLFEAPASRPPVTSPPSVAPVPHLPNPN